jgi:ketosteroid isomerase-like protein
MLCAICAYADESTETSSETEIIALDEAWIDAEVSGDRIALERILHEDFLATFASGRTIDRTTFIDRVLANKPAPFSVTHESIRVHGDTALVIDLSADGKTKFTWIAVKRDGQWRVISETFSTVEST